MTEDGQLIFETERLVFRELVPSLAPFVLTLLTDPTFIKFIGDRGVYDLSSAERYIQDVRTQYIDPGYGSYVVLQKETEKPIGISGIIKRVSLLHPDIGFAYLPKYWGYGYAFEGAEALLKYAKGELGLETVVAITSPGNVSSQKLLKKLGMTFKRCVSAQNTGEEALLFEPVKKITHAQ